MQIEDLRPLKDADFSLVEIRVNHPHCKLHGAMNRFTADGIYRCCSQYKWIKLSSDPKAPKKLYDNVCKAGCQLHTSLTGKTTSENKE